LISLSALGFIAGDFAVGIMHATAFDIALGSRLVSNSIYALYTSLNAVIGGYFVFRAQKLSVFLSEYIRARQCSEHANTGAAEKTISRITNALFASGLYLAISIMMKLGMIFVVSNDFSSPPLFQALRGAYCIVRSRSEYCHVRRN